MRVEGVAGEAGAHFAALRRVVQSQHSHNVIYAPRTMNEVIADSLARQRFLMILLNAFAVVALLLSSVGLYGVISHTVNQRTHEPASDSRWAHKARRFFSFVLSQEMKMAMGGVVIGLLAAFGLTRLLEKMLYGVSATDLATFTVIALLLMTVALLVRYLPARRATKVDPLIALRHE